MLAARHCARDEQGITVVNARWDVVVDCFRGPRDEEIGQWLGAGDVTFRGTIQFYLPDDEQALAQVIGAHLEPADLPVFETLIGG